MGPVYRAFLFTLLEIHGGIRSFTGAVAPASQKTETTSTVRFTSYLRRGLALSVILHRIRPSRPPLLLRGPAKSGRAQPSPGATPPGLEKMKGRKKKERHRKEGTRPFVLLVIRDPWGDKDRGDNERRSAARCVRGHQDSGV